MNFDEALVGPPQVDRYLLNETIPPDLYLPDLYMAQQSAQISAALPPSDHSISRATWRSLDFLSLGHPRGLLMTVDELPTIPTCDKLLSHDAGSPADTLGTYSCADGTWTPHRALALCCPRGGKPGGCAAGEMPCMALAVDDPTYDLYANEEMAHASALPVQIVYMPFRAAVNLSRSVAKPLLLYHWEPSAWIRKLGPFVRVEMPPFQYRGGSNTDTLVIGSAPESFDYPFQNVEIGTCRRHGSHTVHTPSLSSTAVTLCRDDGFAPYLHCV
jgi:hypothetical protein